MLLCGAHVDGWWLLLSRVHAAAVQLGVEAPIEISCFKKSRKTRKKEEKEGEWKERKKRSRRRKEDEEEDQEWEE